MLSFPVESGQLSMVQVLLGHLISRSIEVIPRSFNLIKLGVCHCQKNMIEGYVPIGQSSRPFQSNYRRRKVARAEASHPQCIPVSPTVRAPCDHLTGQCEARNRIAGTWVRMAEQEPSQIVRAVTPTPLQIGIARVAQ